LLPTVYLSTKIEIERKRTKEREIMQIISDTKPILFFHRSVLYLYVVLQDGNEEREKEEARKKID